MIAWLRRLAAAEEAKGNLWVAMRVHHLADWLDRRNTT
jgi:hypothetical protein